MQLALDLLSWTLLTAGSVFCVIGGVGLIRFPDFYCRIHAAGVTDSLGAVLIFLGLMLQSPDLLTAGKLVTCWLFMYLTGPSAVHALAKAAFLSGVRVPEEDRP